MKTVADLMITEPRSLDPEAKIERAWKIMHSDRIRHIPICKDGKLVGLVTQKDLLVNSQNTSFLSLPVAEVMVYGVKTAEADESATAAGQRMFDEKVSCLPVVEDGKLVGILTDTDYLKLALQYLDAEDHALTTELRESLEEFEKDHPELTMVVSRLSDFLAKMGI